jgi:transcriptional regulator with PAS, ATPase and Fis domain
MSPGAINPDPSPDSTRVAASASAPVVVSASAVMAELVRQATRAGESDAKVLVTGESGVGKDLIARLIHARSPRAAGPFVAVNCASLTETLLESELFGHVRGSFTGAYRDKAGQLQLADRGTLFLDEVGEMSLRMQALLLRFLEHGEIQAVGADRPRARVDVRVVAATNRSLEERVESGLFREDLLYRLRVIHLHVPPLRERPDDILPILEHLLARTGRRVTITDAARDLLLAYRWPGNVRELVNVVEQTLALSASDVIGPEQLPPRLRPAAQPVQPRERRRQVADDLYDALTGGGCAFWEHVHPLFLARDVTRYDMRELVKRGLKRTRGNYRALLTLFGMPQGDYKRFLNFLAAHDCSVDYRPFRHGEGDATLSARPPRLVLPPPVAARRRARPT